MDWKALIAQAAPVIVTVEVELPYGRTLNVPIGTLSYGEWMQAELAVPEPPIPRTLAGSGGQKLPNRDDVTYKAALAAATEKRAYLRLAAALEKGGTELPGATLEDKSAAVRDEMDAGVANALLVFLASSVMQARAQAAESAGMFRGE